HGLHKWLQTLFFKLHFRNYRQMVRVVSSLLLVCQGCMFQNLYLVIYKDKIDPRPDGLCTHGKTAGRINRSIMRRFADMQGIFQYAPLYHICIGFRIFPGIEVACEHHRMTTRNVNNFLADDFRTFLSCKLSPVVKMGIEKEKLYARKKIPNLTQEAILGYIASQLLLSGRSGVSEYQKVPESNKVK